eukprot:XP_017952013.1 PREDICTED: integrin alpha-10 [Xenopus tropicalis]
MSSENVNLCQDPPTAKEEYLSSRERSTARTSENCAYFPIAGAAIGGWVRGGTHGFNESSFELEMSQAGFSIHPLEDGLLFGMVGAMTGMGRCVCISEGVPVKMKNHAAYLGYTVSSITLRSGRSLYVAGAPRFKHKGKVILFEMPWNGGLSISQALVGEQIGSYFGSEVCPVDVNGDGATDVLLVAAPMFLGPQNKESGRVYMYRVGQMYLSHNGTLQPDRRAQDSRFGYAMASALDLNHDGFNDVVVGAPLEDNHMGAVYIYHGYRSTILPTYKQRIDSASLQPGLRYFGRSVSAKMDLDGDGLVDVTVGSQGAAVMLRSRSIVRVNASLNVVPPSINMIHKNCRRHDKESVCLNVTLCFSVTSRSPGNWDSRFGLHYNISLDDRKITPRAVFDENSQKALAKRIRVSVGKVTCMNLGFHVTETVDYLRPVGVLLRFNLSDSESSPVLDDRCPSSLKRLVPFFKDCGEDDECITDLVLQARMDINGSREEPYIIRRERKKVAVEVTIENKRENAYNASLRVWFSRNLLFSSVSRKGEAQKVECAALSGNTRSCSVSYPVLRSGSKVVFVLEFEFNCSHLLNRVQIKLTTNSDNTELNETLHDNTASLLVPVRYSPEIYLLSESSLNRYELPSLRASYPLGPEFRTTFKVIWVLPVFIPPGMGKRAAQEQEVQRIRALIVPFPLQTKFKSVRVVSTFALDIREDGTLLTGDTGHRRESILEILQPRLLPLSLWILIGSIIGGLLLLALIIFILWKLGFFTRKTQGEEEEPEGQEQ